MDRRQNELMDFLHQNVFDPVLESESASSKLKTGVRYTIMRLEQRDATGMIQYYWSAIVGTERSTPFAKMMKDEGFNRFEETIDDFRERFTDDWLSGPGPRVRRR